MSLIKSLWRDLTRGAQKPDATDALAERLRTLEPQLRQSGTATGSRALEELRSLTDAHPRSADARSLLGDGLLSAQQLVDAENAYREALKIQPEHARAQEGLGLCLLQSKRLDEAYLHLELAHKLAPMNADVLVHWGLVDLELGNYGTASQRFMSAVERAPNNPHAWHNLGLAMFRMGQFEASVTHLRRALVLKPDHALAHSNLALALRQTGDLGGASEAALRATELKPGNARLWVVRGDLCVDAGDFDQADSAFAQALSIDAHNVGGHIGRGKLLMALGRHDDARAAFETALSQEPSNADACAGLAQLHLLLQRWNIGWDLYEARRGSLPNPVRTVTTPEWQGEDLRGRSILVHAEQGLGDIILFASCLPDLIERGAQCVIDVPPRLETLFRRSFPGARVTGHELTSNGSDWLASLPPVDLHVPMGTLPKWLRREPSAFPRRAAFLTSDATRTTDWQARLAHLPKPHIGITWRGGTVSTARLQRSLELAELLGAFKSFQGTFVCLQYGDVADEIAAAEALTGRAIHAGISGFADIDDVAALTCALDAVVTVCATQAHLSGALGMRAAVLVPANPSWRYGSAGDTMPWYPSLTLVRQHELGAWDDVLDQAAAWIGQLQDPPVTAALTP